MKSIAIINLKNLKQNALKIKKALKKGSKFCAVVKSNAYGHGMVEVANEIYGIVDCFAVGTVEEGVALRQSGIKKDVLCLLPPTKQEIERAVYHSLTLTVDSKEIVRKIERESAGHNKTTKLHLKFNTGMNRLGVDDLKSLEELARFASKSKHITLDGMFSHYATPEKDFLREEATNRFLLAKRLVKGYNKKATCHIGASGGFLFKKHFDMVRIGLLLYGYKPFNANSLTNGNVIDLSVKPAMQVYSPILKERTLRSGDAALYGSKQTNEELFIRLVAYGYADGLPRQEIGGQFSNRCMGISAQIAQKKQLDANGGTVKIKGESLKGYAPIMLDANAVAKQYGTIPYEILTKAAITCDKIYIKD